MQTNKWYGPYKNRTIVRDKYYRIKYEIMRRNRQEKKFQLKSTRDHEFKAQWTTMRELNRFYVILNPATMQVLYGRK